MPGFISLRTKLILILGGFLVLTLGVFGLFLDAQNMRAISEESRAREALFARNVEISINQVLFAGKYQAQAYVERLAQDTEGLVYVAIIEAKTRQVLAHSDPRHVGERWDDPRTRRAFDALASEHPVEQVFFEPDRGTIHDWALPYLRGYLQEPDGIMRIGISASREQALVQQSRWYTLGLILAFVALGLGLSVALGFRLTSSLAALAGTVKRFGDGDYRAAVAVPESPRDELDQLGQAFNQMAARLREYSEHLERLVEERTAQLRESEARLTTFLDNANAVIYLKDLAGRYLLVNTRFEASFERTREEIVGRTDAELVPAALAAQFQANDQRVLASGAPVEFEEVVPDARGPRVYLSIKFPLRDEEGRIHLIGGISQDITERKRLEEVTRQQYEQLKQLDHLKDEFVNAVSHDLRTPLTSIVGYAEFLEDELGGALSPEQAEFVRQIQMGARRLGSLVDDLLDFARLEAGTFKLKPRPGDLRETVREIVDSLRPQAEAARLDLVMEPAEEPLAADFDHRRIQQALTNFMHNAIKFTPPGGTVRVRTAREGRELRVEVADTGPGVAAEDVPRLFQRFSQLQAGVAKGGTGLGLSIAKSLVEAHGGRIGVSSPPGHGATFWFTLPATPAPA